MVIPVFQILRATGPGLLFGSLAVAVAVIMLLRCKDRSKNRKAGFVIASIMFLCGLVVLVSSVAQLVNAVGISRLLASPNPAKVEITSLPTEGEKPVGAARTITIDPGTVRKMLDEIGRAPLFRRNHEHYCDGWCVHIAFADRDVNDRVTLLVFPKSRRVDGTVRDVNIVIPTTGSVEFQPALEFEAPEIVEWVKQIADSAKIEESREIKKSPP